VSHARRDELAVRAFRDKLSALPGMVTFVDWIDAPERDRTHVTEQTAEWLRTKMRQSKAMVLLLSENSAGSFWVQWELGYFDALRGRVVLVPLTQDARDAIRQQEYFGLYEMVDTPDDLMAVLA
jgi:hypothetical protein